MSLPAHNPPIKEAKTRFDEFQAYHITIANDVHVTVSSLAHLIPILKYLPLSRVNSFHGTDRWSCPMRMLCAMSVATKVPIRKLNFISFN